MAITIAVAIGDFNQVTCTSDLAELLKGVVVWIHPLCKAETGKIPETDVPHLVAGGRHCNDLCDLPQLHTRSWGQCHSVRFRATQYFFNHLSLHPCLRFEIRSIVDVACLLDLECISSLVSVSVRVQFSQPEDMKVLIHWFSSHHRIVIWICFWYWDGNAISLALTRSQGPTGP